MVESGALQALRVFVEERDWADLGPSHALQLAALAVERYGPTAPRRPGGAAACSSTAVGFE